MSELVARNLVRRFGRLTVGPVDLALRAGERVALRGANGSGKTTILRCLAGTLAPSDGLATIRGKPAGSRAARADVGVSFAHERSFDLRLGPRENLRFFASLRSRDATAARRAVEAVEEELELDRYPSVPVQSWSSGMLQQLSFARALLGEPSVLLLDEPTRSLDRHTQTRFWDALERRPRAAVLLATHSDDDVARCDRAVDLAR